MNTFTRGAIAAIVCGLAFAGLALATAEKERERKEADAIVSCANKGGLAFVSEDGAPVCTDTLTKRID